jgi:hypothetical protein
MSGARPEADPRFTFHASRFTVLGSGPTTTKMVQIVRRSRKVNVGQALKPHASTQENDSRHP